MKKSHRETQRQPEPLQDAGAGRGTQRGHGTLPTTELASELSPTRPGTALPGPVGTRAGLTPRPPAPTTPARPEKGQHEPACSIPAPCSVRGGPRGWWGGPSAPLLLGRWVMLPSSPGVLLTGVTPAAERGLPAPVQGHAPPSPRPVTRSSSCLPAACQLRMAPAVTPGRCLRCLHSWRSHGDSCWVLAAGGGSGRGDRVPEPCAPPPPQAWTPTAPGLVLPQGQLSPEVAGAQGTDLQAGLRCPLPTGVRCSGASVGRRGKAARSCPSPAPQGPGPVLGGHT